MYVLSLVGVTVSVVFLHVDVSIVFISRLGFVIFPVGFYPTGRLYSLSVCGEVMTIVVTFHWHVNLKSDNVGPQSDIVGPKNDIVGPQSDNVV